MKEQFPTHGASQPKQNEAAGEWSWRPSVSQSQSFEDEEVRRKWEDKTKKAQETVGVFLTLPLLTF